MDDLRIVRQLRRHDDLVTLARVMAELRISPVKLNRFCVLMVARCAASRESQEETGPARKVEFPSKNASNFLQLTGILSW